MLSVVGGTYRRGICNPRGLLSFSIEIFSRTLDIDELYHVVENRFDLENKKDKEKFEKIRAKYRRIAEEHGTEVKAVYHITRDEPSPSLYENADFSKKTIKDSIRHGELKTNEILQNIGWEKWLQEM